MDAAPQDTKTLILSEHRCYNYVYSELTSQNSVCFKTISFAFHLDK